jgi:hypothetical protein
VEKEVLFLGVVSCSKFVKEAHALAAGKICVANLEFLKS